MGGETVQGPVVRPVPNPATLLLEVTGALAEASTREDVVRVALAKALPVMGAERGMFALLESENSTLQVLGTEGLRPETTDRFRTIPVTARLPASEAARTGTSVWVEDRESGYTRFPDLVESSRANGTHAWAAIPMRVEGRTIGVLGLAFAEPRRFPAQERTFIETLANACGQAFERARLVSLLTRQREEAKEMGARYQALVESAMDGIVSADPEGRITFANAAAGRMFGYAPGEFAGVPLTSLIPERFHETYLAAFALANEGHASLDGRPIELVGRMKQGMEFPLEVTIAPARTNGRVEFTAILRDVTERVRAQEVVEEQEAHLNRFKKMFEASIDGIAYIDAEGRYIEQNAAHRRLLGYDESELVGRTPAIHLGDEAFNEIAQTLQETGQYRGNLRSRRKDGSFVQVSLSASTVRDRQGRVVGHVGIKRDISEQISVEGELRAQVEKLQTIHQLTQTVGRAERVEEVYEAALGSLQRALQADRASILLYDADGVMRFKAWTRLSNEYRAAVEGHSPWPQDALDPQPVLVSDVLESADWAAFRHVFEREGIRAVGFIPLLHQETLLGKCMVYYDEPHVFTEPEVQLAQAVAGHVSFAIDRRKGRVALRDADANLRIMMDASPVALTYLNADRRFLYVNRRFADLQGRSRDEVLGRRAEDVWGAEVYHILAPRLDAAFGGEPASVDLTLSLATGPRHLSVQFVPNLGAEGEIRGVLGVIADITDRKEQEEELRAANERLQELDRLKTQFLNAVSHEMRTPLTPIQLQLDVLGSGAANADARKRAVEILDRNVRRLTRLIQEMVDVSRLQAGRFTVERVPVDLGRVVLEAVESYEEPARQAGIGLRLVPSGPIHVEADPQRLAQVLSNLLSNALKFTPAQRAIEVSLGAQGPHAVVRVRDEGAGLTSDQIARLFQPFTQVHGPGESTRSGTGLGLYLCRGMVEAHGGRIWAESEGPGRGSTFAFTLPRGDAA